MVLMKMQEVSASGPAFPLAFPLPFPLPEIVVGTKGDIWWMVQTLTGNSVEKGKKMCQLPPHT
jgi:hypothetical protein